MVKGTASFQEVEPLDISNIDLNSFGLDSTRKADVALVGLIKGLIVKVRSLEIELVAVKRSVEPMSCNVERLSGEVEPLAGNVEKLSEEVAGLKEQISPLSQDVEKLKVDQAQLHNGIYENSIQVAKVEQYSRRGTVTIVGKGMIEGEDIVAVVCEVLDTTDVKLSAADFEAVHRNAREYKTITKNGKTSKVPPSITVRFSNLTKKDKVLRAYKNYTSDSRKKPVRVYQSLTKYYMDLKSGMSEYLQGLGMEVQWIHWRSATAGMVVKLKSGILFKRIFHMDDLLSQTEPGKYNNNTLKYA